MKKVLNEARLCELAGLIKEADITKTLKLPRGWKPGDPEPQRPPKRPKMGPQGPSADWVVPPSSQETHKLPPERRAEIASSEKEVASDLAALRDAEEETLRVRSLPGRIATETDTATLIQLLRQQGISQDEIDQVLAQHGYKILDSKAKVLVQKLIDVRSTVGDVLHKQAEAGEDYRWLPSYEPSDEEMASIRAASEIEGDLQRMGYRPEDYRHFITSRRGVSPATVAEN